MVLIFSIFNTNEKKLGNEIINNAINIRIRIQSNLEAKSRKVIKIFKV